MTSAAPRPVPPATPEMLVVDDEPGYREGIRRILQSRGHRVTVAANGAEALRLVKDKDFPVLLVDLRMPEVDGFEVIQGVRQMRPETLCIVVSAFATIESAVQTTKMGAFDFVAKPFVPDDLMAVVNRAVEKWRLAHEAARLRAEREAHLLELAEEKSRLRTIVQSMAEGLLVVNIDGQVVLDTPLSRRLLGQVHSAALTGPVEHVISDDRFNAEIRNLLAGQDSGQVALELRQPGSEDRYLRATLTPIRDDAPGVRGVAVLLADITDAKAFERMKILFISMVAHELKAPIGAVEGYLNLILSGALDTNPDKRSEILQRCLERTGALLELIRDLTDITRRDAGRHERHLQPLDLAAVASKIAEFHRHDAEKRGIQLEFAVAPGTLPVMADTGDLERVVTNFVSNAIKYNRDQGRVRVRVGMQGALVCLEVEDTGIGMTPEETARLGQDFFRAKNPHTLKITGTGLGVALVKKIVDSYCGALEVDSVFGQGSTFRVLLPAAPLAARARDAGETPPCNPPAS